MKISNLGALEVAELIKNKKISVTEAVSDVLKSIEEKDKTINAYITLCPERALENAEKLQRLIDSGEGLSPLAGVPISVKDNICTKNVKTTCASRILENFIPTYNAAAVEKAENAGMIVVGKLNMDEFAMGSTTETSIFGVTKNPANPEYTAGGSSGGAAAAVAADEAIIALGSDTGGSIRQPCSFCGVTGLKPTYGAVSRYGLVAYASSLDQIGPVGKNAADCAALFGIISGKDKKDSTSMNFDSFDYKEILTGDMRGKRIGIPSDFFGEGISEDVKSAVLQAAEVYKALGAELEFFPMPIVKYAVPAYYIIACAEASSNLSRYDGVKYGYAAEGADSLGELYIKTRSEGFGMEAKRRIMLGNFVLSSGYFEAYYKKALRAKRLIQNAFFEAFEKYDMLLAPVSPETAPKIGESLRDPLKMYLGDICTVMINLAGLPSAAVPCGFDSKGLPVGMQIIGKPFAEAEILRAAHCFEGVEK